MPIDYGYVESSASQAHTFGNVSAFVTDYIQRLFSPKYFKTTNITSTMAYRYVNLMRVSNQNFLYKKKPMLIVRPRLDFNDGDLFLKDTLLTTRITDNFSDRDFGNLLPLLSDANKKVEMRFLMNRIKMYFDTTIVVEKPLEQMNLAMYLKNKVRQNLPFFAEAPLESTLPRDLVRGYAKGFDLDIDNPDHTSAILSHLNTNSLYPITYKLKNSTGNDEFFMYYENQMDAIISDLVIDDGSRKGFRDDAYAISFTFGIEFSTPALFFLFSNKSSILEGISETFHSDSDTIVPMFTIAVGDVEAPPGHTVLTNPAFKIADRNVPEQLPVMQIIPDHVMDTLNAFTAHGVPLTTLLRFAVYRDHEELSSASYTVDWNTLIVTVHGELNTTSTYRLFVFLNSEFINTRAADYYGLTKEK